MKKTYITPDTKVIEITASAIMQASNGTLDKDQSITESTGFGVRRTNYWGDDNDE